MMEKITIKRGDEETEIRVGRKVLASANHDEDGWAGIEALEKLAKAFGKVYGIEVIEK